MIAGGIAIGLYYTWIVNPVDYVNATFYDLRQDYKADYVLMTAEIYNYEPNLFQTMIRLDRLLEESPEIAIENAIRNAGQLGYSETDVDMLYQLYNAVGGKTIENPGVEDIFLEFDPENFSGTAEPADEEPVPTMLPVNQPDTTTTETNPFEDQTVPTVIPQEEDNPFGDFNG